VSTNLGAIQVFEPTASESAEIGLNKGLPFYQDLKIHLHNLNVVNIRVIKKIEKFCIAAHEVLNRFDDKIQYQAFHTIALAGYSVMQPTEAPSLEYLKNFNKYGMGSKEEKAKKIGADAKNETDYSQFLGNYGLRSIDEFDLVIFEGILRGYFDDEALTVQAEAITQRFAFDAMRAELRKPWDLYHGSYENNAKEVGDALYQVSFKNLKALTSSDLDSTIRVLKSLKFTSNAKKLLKAFMDFERDDERMWDLENSAFGDRISDLDVRNAFAAKLASLEKPQNLKAVLEQMAGKNGFHKRDISYLATLRVSDFVKCFLEERGESLHSIIGAALSFQNIGNADDEMKKITKNVRPALQQIAKKSSINALRMARYGIEV
jgi:hypothetical protein